MGTEVESAAVGGARVKTLMLKSVPFSFNHLTMLRG